MTTHYWGDPDFDWAGLDDAIDFICTRLRRWRVGVRQCKEKFGGARIYCSLGIHSLHQLTHPGYVYNQWPKLLWRAQFHWPFTWLTRLLNWLVLPLHVRLYVSTYRKAREQWPHLAQEIYRNADHYELLGAKVKVTHPSDGGLIWWPEWDKEPEVDDE